MIFDIAVLSAIAVSALIAFFRGFIRETLTIIGVLGGAAAAYYFGDSLSPTVRGWFGIDPEAEEMDSIAGIPLDMIADGTAYAGIFIAVMIVLSICSFLLSRSVEAVGLGAIDRTFGVFFGVIRAVLLIALLYLPVYLTFDKEKRDMWFEEASWLKDSRSIVYVEYVTSKLAAMLPQRPETEEEPAEEGEQSSEGEEDTAKGNDPLKALEVLGTLQGVKQKLEGKAATSEEDKAATGYEKEQIQKLDNLIQEEYNLAE